MIRQILSNLALGAALMAAMPAGAQEKAAVHVNFGDLNLATAAGVKVLHLRLEQALDEVCGRFDADDTVRTGPENACRDETRLTFARAERLAIASAEQRDLLASAEREATAR